MEFIIDKQNKECTNFNSTRHSSEFIESMNFGILNEPTFLYRNRKEVIDHNQNNTFDIITLN